MSTLANFTLNVTVPANVLGDPADLLADRTMALRKLERLFGRLAAGIEPGLVGETKLDMQKGSTAAAHAFASQTVTFSGASGTVGATIAGVAKTFAHGASDNADAASLAAAIIADSTLNKFVTATSVNNVCTITALAPGAAGNAVTTVASGTGVSAGGARLAGGVGGDQASTQIAW